MASSSSGGSGTSGGSRPPSGGGGYSGGQPPRSGGGGTGGRDSGQSPFSSSSRPTRPTVPAGQERQVSYQREEERYWTDYLRVALPVVGLLLMLGLFWYWAGSLIGDDDDEEPTPISQVISEPSPTPTEPQTIAISPTQGNNEAAQTDSQEEGDPTPTDETEGANGQQTDGEAQQDGSDNSQDADQSDQGDQTDSSDGFAADDIVVVTEEGADLNLRSEPTIGENIVTMLAAGTELRIIDGPQEAEGYLWYQVANDETGEEGWIVDDVEGSATIELR